MRTRICCKPRKLPTLRLLGQTDYDWLLASAHLIGLPKASTSAAIPVNVHGDGDENGIDVLSNSKAPPATLFGD